MDSAKMPVLIDNKTLIMFIHDAISLFGTIISDFFVFFSPDVTQQETE